MRPVSAWNWHRQWRTELEQENQAVRQVQARYCELERTQAGPNTRKGLWPLLNEVNQLVEAQESCASKVCARVGCLEPHRFPVTGLRAFRKRHSAQHQMPELLE